MKKQVLIIFSIAVCSIIVFIFNLTDSKPKYEFQLNAEETEINHAVTEVNPEENFVFEEEKIYVDVKGAVLLPGIYEVKANFRIYDVIALAGGFTDDADVNLINLSQKISDEMVIYVAVKGENTEGINIQLQMMNPTSNDSNDKVSINRGSVEQLMSLPGIGVVKAEAIVKYRTEVGAFKSIDELLLVNGIGSKTFEAISELIIP